MKDKPITEADFLKWLRRDLEYLLGVSEALQIPQVNNRVIGMITTYNNYTKPKTELVSEPDSETDTNSVDLGYIDVPTILTMLDKVGKWKMELFGVEDSQNLIAELRARGFRRSSGFPLKWFNNGGLQRVTFSQNEGKVTLDVLQ